MDAAARRDGGAGQRDDRGLRGGDRRARRGRVLPPDAGPARDYVLSIAVSDLDAYERLYMERLTDLPGVARTNSQLTMKIVKSSSGQMQ
jgi:DNA-binding Lrp family transcriptional regulator